MPGRTVEEVGVRLRERGVSYPSTVDLPDMSPLLSFRVEIVLRNVLFALKMGELCPAADSFPLEIVLILSTETSQIMIITSQHAKTAALLGYTINREGTEVRMPSGKLMKMTVKKGGHKEFGIGPKGKRSKVLAHRMQAWFKYGEAMFEPGIICRHKDEDATNNHWDNIVIGTQQDNMMDQSPEVRHARAFKASRGQLKHDHVAILDFYRLNGFNATLAHFSITSKGTLSYIINKTQTATPVSIEDRPKRFIPASEHNDAMASIPRFSEDQPTQVFNARTKKITTLARDRSIRCYLGMDGKVCQVATSLPPEAAPSI